MPDIQNFPAADLARKTSDILDTASRAPGGDHQAPQAAFRIDES